MQRVEACKYPGSDKMSLQTQPQSASVFKLAALTTIQKKKFKKKIYKDNLQHIFFKSNFTQTLNPIMFLKHDRWQHVTFGVDSPWCDPHVQENVAWQTWLHRPSRSCVHKQVHYSGLRCCASLAQARTGNSWWESHKHLFFLWRRS